MPFERRTVAVRSTKSTGKGAIMSPEVIQFARSAQGARDDGHQLDDDKIEAVGPVSIPNMRVFDVTAGEVKQIDTPYP
jgi:hypothetical protein